MNFCHLVAVTKHPTSTWYSEYEVVVIGFIEIIQICAFQLAEYEVATHQVVVTFKQKFGGAVTLVYTDE